MHDAYADKADIVEHRNPRIQQLMLLLAPIEQWYFGYGAMVRRNSLEIIEDAGEVRRSRTLATVGNVI